MVMFTGLTVTITNGLNEIQMINQAVRKWQPFLFELYFSNRY